jgi:hypothetical protein
MPRLIYQNWLHWELPEKTAPMWSLPLPLKNGGALATFLFRPLTTPATAPRTVILELDAAGDSKVWAPAAGYPAPVMFYGDSNDVLYGFDLTLPGKVYACDVFGKHVATLEMSLKLANLLSPEFFTVRGKTVYWVNSTGQRRQAEIGAALLNEKPAEHWPESAETVHFPHTHVVGGRLFVFDFDPMPRVSAYTLE